MRTSRELPILKWPAKNRGGDKVNPGIKLVVKARDPTGRVGEKKTLNSNM